MGEDRRGNILVMKKICLLVLVMLVSGSALAQEKLKDGCVGLNAYDELLCYVDLAVKLDEVNACDPLAALKYQCYAIFAERKQDERICEKIPGADSGIEDIQELKDLCFSDVAKVKKDAAICGKIATGTFRDGCYLQVSKLAGDVAVCEKIVAAETRNWCKGQPVYIEQNVK